jgi:hypothetical protein
MKDDDTLVPRRVSLDRTTRFASDLDWLWPEARVRYRWFQVGGAVTASVLFFSAVLGAHWLFDIPSLTLAFVASGGVPFAPMAGARVGRRWALRDLRRRSDRLAEAVTVRQLGGRVDGDIVRVRGIVKRGAAALSDSPDGCVFERAIIGQLERERAVDFVLVDENGEELMVEVADARLTHFFDRGDRDNCSRVWVGDAIEVVGRKSRIVDPNVDRLPRQDPVRAVLRAPLPDPLLIVPST